MDISLTPEQEHLIQSKLQTGKYRSAEEALELALRLLDIYDHADAEWVEEVRIKVDATTESSNHTLAIDGKQGKEMFILTEKRRSPPSSIAGKGKTLGDIVSPLVSEEDWECLK